MFFNVVYLDFSLWVGKDTKVFALDYKMEWQFMEMKRGKLLENYFDGSSCVWAGEIANCNFRETMEISFR